MRRQAASSTVVLSLSLDFTWGGGHMIRSEAVVGVIMFPQGHSGVRMSEAAPCGKECVVVKHRLNISSSSPPLNESSLAHLEKGEGISCLVWPVDAGHTDWEPRNCTMHRLVVDRQGGHATVWCKCSVMGLYMAAFQHPPTPNYTMPKIDLHMSPMVEHGIVVEAASACGVIMLVAFVGWACTWIRLRALTARLSKLPFEWWTVGDVWDAWDRMSYQPPEEGPHSTQSFLRAAPQIPCVKLPAGCQGGTGKWVSPRKPALLVGVHGKQELQAGDMQRVLNAGSEEARLGGGERSQGAGGRRTWHDVLLHVWRVMTGEAYPRREPWPEERVKKSRSMGIEGSLSKWWDVAGAGAVRMATSLFGRGRGGEEEEEERPQRRGDVTWTLLLTDWLEGNAEEGEVTWYVRCRAWYRADVAPEVSAARGAVVGAWGRASRAFKNSVAPMSDPVPDMDRTPRSPLGGARPRSPTHLAERQRGVERCSSELDLAVKGQVRVDATKLNKKQRLAEEFVRVTGYEDEDYLEWIPDEVCKPWLLNSIFQIQHSYLDYMQVSSLQ